MHRTFTLLAVAEGRERSSIKKILKEFAKRYQFSCVRVQFEKIDRISIKRSRNCDLILIGLSSSTKNGARALQVSDCPCVVWTETLSRSNLQTMKRTGIDKRTKLLLVRDIVRSSPPVVRGTPLMIAFGEGKEFEYKAAIAIMGVLLSDSREIQQQAERE